MWAGKYITAKREGPWEYVSRSRGIRAAVCNDTFTAHETRAHNDANVLCMGGRVIGSGLARDIVKTWLETQFSQGERHTRRVGKMTALDEER